MRKTTFTLIASSALLLGACSASDDNTPTPTDPGSDTASVSQANINATNYDTPAYFDFETGTTVSESDDWDVGFIRDKVIVNDGKRTAIADKQQEYYNSDGVTPANNGQAFANATDATELQSLLSATSILDSWVESGIKTAIGGDWNIPGHPLVPTNQYYILRSAGNNSYAKFVVSDIQFTGVAYQVTMDFYVQGVGENAFAATASQWVVTSGADACYDFDSASDVACTNAGWDVKFGGSDYSLPIFTNGGVSGSADAAVYKLGDSETEADYQHGDFRNADQSGVFPAAWQQDVKASIFADYSWYAYDPLNDGKHQLYSNYRVYVIDTDTVENNGQPYKMQITSYYNDSGVSGHYSIRYAPLNVSE